MSSLLKLFFDQLHFQTSMEESRDFALEQQQIGTFFKQSKFLDLIVNDTSLVLSGNAIGISEILNP